MNDRPKSWWRKLLGYKAIMVIDEMEFIDVSILNGPRGRVLKHHYEWRKNYSFPFCLSKNAKVT